MLLYSARTEGYKGESIQGIDRKFEVTGVFSSAVFRVMPHGKEPARYKRTVQQMQSVKAITLSEYREFVSLPSAKREFRKLFLALGDHKQLPALFHCTTGKDRTGWAAAAMLTLLAVPKDKVLEDYLRSNDYILPAYKKAIDGFVAAGEDKSIPLAILGVKKEYLDAAFDEMQKKHGTIEKYFSEGLGIDSPK